jgi:Family of unknown function (DUF5302)
MSMPQEVRMAVEQSGTEASPGRPVPKTPKAPEAREAAAPEVAADEAAAPEVAADEAAAPEVAAADPELDAMKRKFREALARKRGTHARAEGADHTGKVHGSHGPASGRRSFRRKSG